MREKLLPYEEIGTDGERLFISRTVGNLVLTEVLGDEMARDLLIEEADEEIEDTLVDRVEGLVFLGCGDDRGISKASAQQLEAGGLPGETAYMKYFGGDYGVARIALVAEGMQYGTKSLKKTLGRYNFMDFATQFHKDATKKAGVIPATHSSIRNERNKATLNPESPFTLACAYAHLIGEVSYIAATNRGVQRLSKEEFKALFSPNANSELIELASEANRDFISLAFGEKPREYSISRAEVIKAGIPAMLLYGEHADSTDTFLLANFSTDKLTDSQKAKDIGRPYYAIDFTQVAETIMKTRPEMKYDPEILFAAMIPDVAATRAALASHDGPANPERIALVKYGDPEEALDYLRSLQ